MGIKLNFQHITWYFYLIILCDVKSFLLIMIRHNVEFFCKIEPRFMPLSIFHFTHILLLMMKMNANIFHMWKIRTEGRSLKSIATLFSKITTIVISKPCFNSVFRDEHKTLLGTVNDKHHRGMPSGIGGFLYFFLTA